MARHIQRALAGVRSGFRAVLAGLDRSPKVQLASGEGLADERLQAHELFQQFGFTSAPPAGTQMIMLPLGARTSAAVVVATEHGNYRVVLGAQGEVCVYSLWGDRVHLREDRTILVQAPKVVVDAATSMTINTPVLTVNASTQVNLNTPLVHATGDVTAVGNVADANGAKTMASMRATFDAHTHVEHGGSGPTDPPGEAM